MQLVRWLPKFLHRHKILDFICKFGGEDCVIPVTYNSNARTVIDLRDPEPRNVFIQKQFEPDFFDLANSFLAEKGTFFDLGANVGLCSFGLIPTRPKTSFHLFEANPNLMRLLRQSVELHPNQSFQLNHCCISDTQGKTNFNLEAKQSGQSHVCPTQNKGIEVPNLVLDAYCDQKQITNIDFVKLDIEGHELPALQGWVKNLSDHCVKAIYIEIIPENQKRYGRKTNAPLAYLESLGYSLFLCKDSDFGLFGEHPIKNRIKKGTPLLAKFRANEYLPSFSTDVLALSPN
jgi:FkbM family methyltransferase